MSIAIITNTAQEWLIIEARAQEIPGGGLFSECPKPGVVIRVTEYTMKKMLNIILKYAKAQQETLGIKCLFWWTVCSTIQHSVIVSIVYSLLFVIARGPVKARLRRTPITDDFGKDKGGAVLAASLYLDTAYKQ